MAPSPKLGPKKISNHSSSSIRKGSHASSSSSSQPILNVAERVELNKLAAILPSVSQESDPTDVVLQAASYIDRLVATVQARVKNGTLPADALKALPPLYSKKPTRRLQSSRKSRRSVEKKR